MTCHICNKPFPMFKGNDGKPVSELEARATHLATHNPTPKQWGDAYDKIREWREKKLI